MKCIYLLLKELDNDKFLVEDFGDIEKYNISKSLNFYKVNDNCKDILSNHIYLILVNIKNWLKLTGYEFIIDSKEFKIIKK